MILNLGQQILSKNFKVLSDLKGTTLLIGRLRDNGIM